MKNAKEVTIKRLKERYFEFVHKSGLKVVVCPTEDRATYYALLGSAYGSINNSFKSTNGEVVTVPEGIAHFLEHKLFESKNGQDVFKYFAKNGARVNAFTSHEKTCYHFSCTNNFFSNLELLLDFVTSPCFSNESIEKERGIIGQEIGMCEDDPYYQADCNALNAMYGAHPIAQSILGTVVSISKITKELLTNCYNTYYVPCNMVLVVVGDVELADILRVVDKFFFSCDFAAKPPENFIPKEPYAVRERIVQKDLPIALPWVEIGIKERAGTRADGFLNGFKYWMLLQMLFGEASEFCSDCYRLDIIREPLWLSSRAGDGFCYLDISGATPQPEKLYQMVLDELRKQHLHGLNKANFQRIKKYAIAQYVRRWEDTESLAVGLFDLSCLGLGFNDIDELIANLEAASLDSMFAKTFQEEQTVLSVVKSSSGG
ncbi:MAG: insulinase family protein [Oscillospiraceae bacterium]|nr:insulinase family protein [Oscillospiraceae bacterium]